MHGGEEELQSFAFNARGEEEPLVVASVEQVQVEVEPVEEMNVEVTSMEETPVKAREEEAVPEASSLPRDQ